MRAAPGLVARGANVLAVLLLSAFLAAGWARAASADAGLQEQRKIEAQALDAFQRIMTLWQEEAYFELYDHGTAASKARIRREDFAERMVKLDWIPSGEINPRFLKPEFRFRTMIYIQARIPYRNKFNVGEPFTKEQTVQMLLEDGEWRIDLIQLIRSPYVE